MTPRYYVIKLQGLTPHTDLEKARKVAESNSEVLGEEFAILVAIGITKISATTTWLDKRDITGACEQTTSHPTTPVDGWTPPVDLMLSSTGWSWPTLPPGHSYLNPENLTVEQLGDGWRPLCTLDERFPEDYQLLACEDGWKDAIPSSNRPQECLGMLTYRTRAPIPTLQ